MFNEIIKQGVALAKDLTSSLQVDVTHRPWITQGAFGEPDYGASKKYRAIYEKKLRQVRDPDTGSDVFATSYIAILSPISNTTAAPGQVRQNPVDTRDLFVLPDGIEARVLQVEGLVNPGTKAPYMFEVWLE